MPDINRVNFSLIKGAGQLNCIVRVCCRESLYKEIISALVKNKSSAAVFLYNIIQKVVGLQFHIYNMEGSREMMHYFKHAED